MCLLQTSTDAVAGEEEFQGPMGRLQDLVGH